MLNSSLAKGRTGSIGSISTAAILTAALLIFTMGLANAQNNNKKPQKHHENAILTTAPDLLKEKVTLPDLPEYTGKSKYLSGLVYNHMSDSREGPTYVMTFNAKESSEQVRDWWLNSLRQYRWNITYTSVKVISGVSKDGSLCTIHVDKPVHGYAKDDRSSYSVRYQAAKP